MNNKNKPLASATGEGSRHAVRSTNTVRDAFTPGDTVNHVGITGNPRYAALHQNGTVLKVTTKRVIVRWPRGTTKIYMPSQLLKTTSDERTTRPESAPQPPFNPVIKRN